MKISKSARPPTPANGCSDERMIAIWDWPIRLFHWLTVALILIAYATLRLNWMVWHARAGYALLVLLLFRLLWGFLGSESARFSSFVAAPSAALRHLGDILRRTPERRMGHNPAGGWMVLLLLALMFGQTLTGIYVDNDIADEGPLTEIVPANLANAIEALHDEVLWDALLAAIAIHVLAIVVYAFKGYNLALPMITGHARAPKGAPAPHMVKSWRAVPLVGLSAAVTAALARFL